MHPLGPRHGTDLAGRPQGRRGSCQSPSGRAGAEGRRGHFLPGAVSSPAPGSNPLAGLPACLKEDIELQKGMPAGLEVRVGASLPASPAGAEPGLPVQHPRSSFPFPRWTGDPGV